MSDELDQAEALALRALAEEAHAFGQRYRPRRAGANVPASYAQALRGLAAAARMFAQKSDAAWAQEVIDARAR